MRRFTRREPNGIQAKTGCVSAAAIFCLVAPTWLVAQTTPPTEPPNEPPTEEPKPVPPETQLPSNRLPTVSVDATRRRPRAAPSAPKRRIAAARPQPAPPTPSTPQQPTDTQDARTGTVGVYSNSTAVATKTNTPLINIPQSLSVLTKSFIADQSFQSVTDATRYVPGVAVHQGEGNRDELVIRGVDSSANFFVNGFRDDVQIFRDLYNVQSIEVLNGPSALTFGRGVGGGLVNRTLKDADGQRIYEITGQTGSYWNRRV